MSEIITKQIKLMGGLKVEVDVMDERICKGCGNVIFFGRTPQGKWMPIIEFRPGVWQDHAAHCKTCGEYVPTQDN